MEGEENTPETPLNEESSTAQHSEFELTFVLIMIGLLGIAFFAWYVGSGGGNIKDRVTFLNTQEQVQEEVSILTDPISPDDVVGRDPAILSLRNDASVGQYFTHPDLEKTLYIVEGECLDECLESWTPYVASEVVAQGNIFTINREDTGDAQYTWKGEPLYTYNEDTIGSVLGDGALGVWHIARP